MLCPFPLFNSNPYSSFSLLFSILLYRSVLFFFPLFYPVQTTPEASTGRSGCAHAAAVQQEAVEAAAEASGRGAEQVTAPNAQAGRQRRRPVGV